MENPFFEVKKERLVTESGIPTEKFGIVSDTGKILGVVSKNYNIVENKEVDEFFKPITEKYNTLKVVDHLDSTKKRWKRQYVFKDERLVVPVFKDDAIGILLEIWNGYSGNISFGYNLMGYRFFCENGMVTGKKLLLSKSFSHVTKDKDLLSNSFNENSTKLIETCKSWKEWINIPFGFEKFKTFIKDRVSFGNKNPNRFLPEKTAENVINSYEPVLNNLGLEDNAWGSFNVLTYITSNSINSNKGSFVFSNKYNHVTRLANEFYDVV